MTEHRQDDAAAKEQQLLGDAKDEGAAAKEQSLLEQAKQPKQPAGTGQAEGDQSS
jgi:hypothetical protein